ncbi:MAG TPA: exodeoxyribonuclease VII small subunit [Phycisphaeraceae bacterium]|nr:exodeoxyribonuclease VII small subunit [Phycisphaeraceae bacterium]
MTQRKKKPAITKNLSFEDGIEELESIVERIEAGEVGIEESLAEYERGMKLLQHCKSILDKCEQRITDLTKKLESDDETDEKQRQIQPAEE